MADVAKWYIIHTYSGYENKVAQTIMKVVENRKLHDLIYEVNVPIETVMEPVEEPEKTDIEPDKDSVKTEAETDAETVSDEDKKSVKKAMPKKKERKIERKIYPGYVLVKMICNDDSWYVIKNTRGVTGFVGPGSEPTPLTDEEVAALNVESKKTIEINFKPGDQVEVIKGPMDGYIGTVKSLDLDERTVDILISMFGRETPATLDISQVKKKEY